MLRIAMDTAGDLCSGWQKEYKIDLIPINIIHNGISYLQGIDIQYDDFYNLVEKENVIPSTSQPTPYQFVEFYKRIAKPGESILSIHVTDKLSGTMDSARQAADELREMYNIIPFDSASGTICMGMMCREARKMDRAGKSLDEILNTLESIRRKMELVFTVDTMKFARLSGRVKSIQATLASLLDIKPIIELRDGIIEIKDKVRSRNASIEKMISRLKEKVGDQPLQIAVVHAHDPLTGQDVVNEVKKTFNCVEVAFAEISISLAVHFGPGTIGLAAYPE
ncbi:MAG: DegV family protein [Anaerolineaceae bacterium]|jgi:DegV family protein with EDD domain|nr:MAG: DegV family protein [Anaerolineaceae bacterium]